MTTLITLPQIVKPKRTRKPTLTKCPSCGTNGQSAGNTVKCSNCGLVAPRKAFLDSAGSARTWGQPRAFSSRGNID